jgi:hypothetical protein
MFFNCVLKLSVTLFIVFTGLGRMNVGFQSVHDAFSLVNNGIKSCKDWTLHKMSVVVAKSLTDDEEVVINLMDTLGFPGRVTQQMIADGLVRRHWLPKNFNQNNEDFRQLVLCKHFSQPALEEGFGLRMRGWREDRNYLTFFAAGAECSQKARRRSRSFLPPPPDP